MRKSFFFIFLFIYSHSTNSYSQDLIVTHVGDSLNCKVVARTKEYIRYSYPKYNNGTERELRAALVKIIRIGYYRNDHVVTDKSPEKVSPQLKGETIPADTSIQLIADDETGQKLAKWQLGINGGYAYRLFKSRIKSTPYERKYADELKSGYSVGADIFYFPWEKLGFGFKYDMYKSKGQRDIRTSDDITIQFIGISAAHRQMFQNRKASIITAFWLGYQPYHNNVRFVGQDFELDARTMGWGVSVGADRKVTQNLALSFGASVYLGSIYKWKKEFRGRTELINLSKDDFVDLSRAELTIGLKFLK